jgi:flagellin
MALVVNTNVASLVAQNNLVGSRAEMEQAMERLSSGKRINSAADDAAGLAISNRMQAQTRGLSQAIRNANDGVSLADTAEGTMQEVTNMLQRMRELAVQSANGIYNDADRVSLNEEVSQLKAEMNRIADTTTFNNRTLLDGTFGNLQLQLGHNDGQSLTVSMADVRATSLGTSDVPSLTSYGALAGNAVAVAAGAAPLAAVGALLEAGGTSDATIASGDLTINGVSVGESLASYDTLSTAAKSASAISKAAAINAVSDQTGVRAVVNETVLDGAVMTAAAGTGTIIINGVETGTITVTTDAGESRANVVAEINKFSAQTGVVAIDSGSDNNGVQLVAEDGRNIAVTLTTAATGAMTAATTGIGMAATADRSAIQTGTFTLESINSDPIVLGTASSTVTDINKAGLALGEYAAGQSSVVSGVRATATAAPTSASSGVLNLGDMVINGITIAAALGEDDTASHTGATGNAPGSVKKDSAIAIAAAINKSTAQTGVSAKARENVVVGQSTYTAAALNADTITLNGVNVSSAFSTLTTTTHTREDIATAFNTFSGQTGVVVSDNGVGLTFTAADGRNISLASTGSASDFGLAAGDIGATATAAVTHYSTVELTSESAFEIEAGANGSANLNALGFRSGTYGGTGDGAKIADISVATQDSALQALASIDNALETVLEERGKLGAIRNRLDFTAANLGNVVTNTEASRSQIEDADFAAESAKMAKNQILLQAGTAMLAQANASQQTVLSLLG